MTAVGRPSAVARPLRFGTRLSYVRYSKILMLERGYEDQRIEEQTAGCDKTAAAVVFVFYPSVFRRKTSV